MAKKQKLTVFLLKGNERAYEDTLKAPDKLVRYDVAAGAGFPGAVFIKRSRNNPPRWLRFLNSGVDVPIEGLFSATSSAMLILESASRLFAVSFGYAHSWLKDDEIERRFGLIVTLNAVNPEKIRSVDAQQFDVITTSTSTQTSRGANVDTFGLDVQRDIMRAVTGEPEDKKFADRLTGRDALVINAHIEFHWLADKCARALNVYKQKRYKELFPWVDHLKRVRDPSIIDALDGQLIEALNARSFEKLHLSPPRVIDFENVDGFRYSSDSDRQRRVVDLDVGEFLDTLGDAPDLTSEALKKKYKVEVYLAGGETPVDRFRLYDAFVFEVGRAATLAVLSYGEWFEGEQSYVNEVDEQVGKILDDDQLKLPNTATGESEGEYNARVAQESAGKLALLDKKVISHGGGYSKIELCDLFSDDRRFVHVKSYTGSASLSHLFQQGLNSAQLFLYDPDFRKKASRKAPATHTNLLNVAAVDARDYYIVYAIITEGTGGIPASLPFFSKQSLGNASKLLTQIQYNVRLKKIPRS